MKTFQEIKKAVDSGKAVHWHSAAYIVLTDTKGNYGIRCENNGSYVGLHEPSYNPVDFFIGSLYEIRDCVHFDMGATS